MEMTVLLCPSMSAMLVGAHVVQPHLFLSSSGLSLEEDSLAVATLGTGMVLGLGQCGVRDHIRHYVGQLINFVHNFVNINAVAISQGLVVTVAASI